MTTARRQTKRNRRVGRIALAALKQRPGALHEPKPVGIFKRTQTRMSQPPWPVIGAVTTGAGALVAASLVGAAEVALGLGVAFATYEILSKRTGLVDAMKAATSLEGLGILAGEGA